MPESLPVQDPPRGEAQAEWVAFAPAALPPPRLLADLPDRAALLDLSAQAGVPQPPFRRRA